MGRIPALTNIMILRYGKRKDNYNAVGSPEGHGQYKEGGSVARRLSILMGVNNTQKQVMPIVDKFTNIGDEYLE